MAIRHPGIGGECRSDDVARFHRARWTQGAGHTAGDTVAKHETVVVVDPWRGDSERKVEAGQRPTAEIVENDAPVEAAYIRGRFRHRLRRSAGHTIRTLNGHETHQIAGVAADFGDRTGGVCRQRSAINGRRVHHADTNRGGARGDQHESKGCEGQRQIIFHVEFPCFAGIAAKLHHWKHSRAEFRCISGANNQPVVSITKSAKPLSTIRKLYRRLICLRCSNEPTNPMFCTCLSRFKGQYQGVKVLDGCVA